jgi:hypothetical protein
MPSEAITMTGPADAVSDDRPEDNPTAGRSRDGEQGEASVPSEPARASKAGESHDFPYFDFYPYGYLY